SLIPACKSQPAFPGLPSGKAVTGAIYSVCQEMPGMSDCKICPGPDASGYSKCDEVKAWQGLCLDMPDMKQCPPYNTMCTNTKFAPFCSKTYKAPNGGGGSATASGATPAPTTDHSNHNNGAGAVAASMTVVSSSTFYLNKKYPLKSPSAMNQTQAALHALPCDLFTKLCRSKVTRLSLKQMYTLGRHVLESKNQGALIIPAVFLHQELPIRLSHALKMLNSNLLPVNMAEMPTFQQITRSYLEDISMVTQMPKPSNPQQEEDFTALLRNLEERHKVKMLAIGQGFKELMATVHSSRTEGSAGSVGACWTMDPQVGEDIQTFFNRFYTINLGTRLLIGEHLALHDRGLNLVQRVSPLAISQRAIVDAQRVCSAHYGHQSFSPSVVIQTSNPDISTTYVDEFLHRNIFELLKNAMRATCETHLRDGRPMTTALSSTSSSSPLSTENTPTAARPRLPHVDLTLVDGGEDVTIKITDQGGGLALSEIEKVWSYTYSVNEASTEAANLLYSPMGERSGLTLSNGAEAGRVSEAKDYVDLPFNMTGHGLPLARLVARYFGGDLSLVSMEGYGTTAYLSLYRNDDHLENIPEMDEEMLEEIDVFVNELLEECLPTEQPAPTPAEIVGLDLDLGLRKGLVPEPELRSAPAPTRSRLPSSSLPTKPASNVPSSMALGLNVAGTLSRGT
ncbi:hypothetical protein BGZ70_004137, partial [Mortierella alpina]